MNILITSASRKVSIIKAFQDALSQEDPGKVIAVDANPLSPALFKSDMRFVVPKSSRKEFITTIIALCKKYKVRLIVPTRDEELLLFSRKKDLFHAMGVEVMIAPPEVIELCLDKQKFLSFCEKNNIPVPKTYTVTELQKTKVRFPLFVKPKVSKSSKGTFVIKDRKELNFFLRKADSFIFQEFINAKEYTIDLFSDFSGEVISVVPRERIGVFDGETFIGKTYKDTFLINAAIHLAQKMHLVGHNTIQCFYDKGSRDVKFIEINPRFGGGAALGFKSGANTPLWLIKLLLGKRVCPRIGKFKENLIMLRYTEDIFVLHGSPIND